MCFVTTDTLLDIIEREKNKKRRGGLNTLQSLPQKWNTYPKSESLHKYEAITTITNNRTLLKYYP